MAGRRVRRVGAVSGVLALAVFSGGIAGAQTEEQYASEAGGGTVPVLEERIREQDVRLEGEIDRISAVGAELEESQLRAEGARARARDLEEQTRGLRRQLEAQEEAFRAAEAEYERRATAAYKGGGSRGIALVLDGLFGAGEGGSPLAYPRLAEVLFGDRESIEAYEESRRTLADTTRQISQKERDYEAALKEERERVGELRRRERDLEGSIARISAGRERTEARLQELESAERTRVLRTRPATGGTASVAGGGAGTRDYEVNLAREGIVARAVAPIPKQEYVRLYRESAKEYGFGPDWYILAAVGEVESDHGANMGPSSAGAMGPMQFLPSTWEASGVDGNGDGAANIMDPEDAIPAAAGYLKEGGAPKDWYRALYSYNHADWYVKKVLGVAEGYRQLAEDDRVGPYS